MKRIYVFFILAFIAVFPASAAQTKCVVETVEDSSLIDNEQFAQFLKPFLNCLIPNTTVNYNQDKESYIGDLPNDHHFEIYIDNLRQELLNSDRNERPKKIEHFFQTMIIVRDGKDEVVGLESVMPILRSSAMADTLKEQLSDQNGKLLPVLYDDVATGLIEIYVSDSDEAIFYLTDEQLQKWKISKIELQQKAVENLRRYIQSHPINLEDKGPLTVISLDHHYETSVAFLPEFWESMVKKGKGARPVVSFYARDLVAFVYDNNEDAVAQLRKIANGSSDRPYAVSRMLYVWDNGKWQVFK